MFNKLTKLVLCTIFFSFVTLLHASDANKLTEEMNQLIKDKKEVEAGKIASKIIAISDATPEQKFAAYSLLFKENRGGWSTGTSQW
ncbi:MAG: hypothetical protein GX811_10820, partial [Lentisphaerae bacterium]|nr:hypothetical protein [Lentisphaerota bacterium]